MKGCFDTTCPDCGTPVRWSGEFVDRPECRECGHYVPFEELQAMEAKLEESISPAARTREMQRAGESIRHMINRRGIGLRDAAARLGMRSSELCSVMAGDRSFTPQQQTMFELMCAGTPLS